MASLTFLDSYRRGKLQSNDVDLLVTWPNEDGRERGVLPRLVKRLEGKGR